MLLPTGSVTLSKIFNLSEMQFLHLSSEDNTASYRTAEKIQHCKLGMLGSASGIYQTFPE